MADMLPANATPIERAVEQLGAERMGALDVGAIRAAHSPDACPTPVLPWAAWAVDAPWPRIATDAERRSHIKTSLRRHRINGTLAGLRMAAASTGAAITRAITPPGKVFASPALTASERNAHLSRYPELRIYRHRDHGQAGHVSFAVGHAQRFMVQSDAIMRLADRAFIVRDGVETELASIIRTVTDADRVATTITEVRQPGVAGHHAFIGAVPRWPSVTTAAARITTARIDTPYRDGSETIRRETVAPGLDPINVRPVEVASHGAMDSLIPGRAFVGAKSSHNAGRGHLIQSSAPLRLYRSLSLFDPSVPAMRRGASLHLNQGVLGMPPHRAELSVQITGRMDTRRWAGPFVRGHLVTCDKTALTETMSSMRESARVSDRIAIRTTTRRIPRAGEHHLSGSVLAGAVIATR